MLHGPQATCSTQAPDAAARAPTTPTPSSPSGRAADQPAPGAARSTPATPNTALGCKRPNSSMQTRTRVWGKSENKTGAAVGTLNSIGSDKKTGQEQNQPNPPSQSPDSQQIRAENGPVTPTRNARNAPRVALTGRIPPFSPHDLGHTAGYVRLTTNKNRRKGGEAGPALASDAYYPTASFPGTVSY